MTANLTSLAAATPSPILGSDDPRPIVLPSYPSGPLSPRDILLGRPLDPRQVIATYSDDEYETFVKEWARDGLSQRYSVVRRASGSGDMGRDVLGFVTAELDRSLYDNFQCKHYRGSLAPGDVWTEIGKVCWYTFRGEYRVPRNYYFVASRGVGPRLQRYLEAPDRLRLEFLANWEGHCATAITRNGAIPLTDDLRRYVEAFDFRIFKTVDPDELIAQHAKTRWHAARFGGGLLRPRPPAAPPPNAVQTHETRYVRQLLDAYGDHLGPVSLMLLPSSRTRRSPDTSPVSAKISIVPHPFVSLSATPCPTTKDSLLLWARFTMG